jgi:hypothetical protein
MPVQRQRAARGAGRQAASRRPRAYHPCSKAKPSGLFSGRCLSLAGPPVRLQCMEWPSARRLKRTLFLLRHSQSKNAFRRRRAQSTNQACFLAKCEMPLRATDRVAFHRPGQSHNFPFKCSFQIHVGSEIHASTEKELPPSLWEERREIHQSKRHPPEL